MSNGTPCSSQLIWCETRVEKLEQQLIEWKELARNIDNQLRTELAAETNNKREFERDWLACCDKLNDERRIHLELEETLVKKLEAAQAREKVLMVAIESLVENVDRPPDANCSCHISPPCSDSGGDGSLLQMRMASHLLQTGSFTPARNGVCQLSRPPRLSRLERSVSRMTAEGEKMFAWLKRLFDRSNDPVYSCEMYRDKEAGSCTHVDGPLCDFPKCSMLADYRQQKEGMTIKDDPRFREDLRKMMAEQRGKSGPVPHA